MRCPFPGMDPYLEDPAIWPGVHTRLIVSLSDQLSEKVSPKFYVAVEERVYVVQPDFTRRAFAVPDLTLVKPPRTTGESALAVGEITVPTEVEPLFDTEIPDRYLEIRDSQNHEVVATIELLSPINKHRGSPGYEAFWNNRHELFLTQVHWIEIDLLREGERPARLAGRSDYYALLKRGGQWQRLYVWFFNVRDTMPTIAVPLRPPFPDVPLNLQAAFETTYARAHYAESVDYTRMPPPPPLRAADEGWIAERVREWMQARAQNPSGQAQATRS